MSNCWTTHRGGVVGTIDPGEVAVLRAYVTALSGLIDRRLSAYPVRTGFVPDTPDEFTTDSRLRAIVQLGHGLGLDEPDEVLRACELDSLTGTWCALALMLRTLRNARGHVELSHADDVAAWQRGLDDLSTWALAMSGRTRSEVVLWRTFSWLNDMASGLARVVVAGGGVGSVGPLESRPRP
ncbi:hypothetical protein ACFWN2_07140 [Lentzea sp. NPDC058436]|uniref:DUF2017 family protein n=1 Tax=Lentzea sp. NPDC058436 TaxID=3346499 RepID=UPI00365AC922